MAGYLEFKRPTLSGNPFEKPLDIETYSFGMKSNGAVGEQINDLQVERNYDKGQYSSRPQPPEEHASPK
jgi:hypothetical protein